MIVALPGSTREVSRHPFGESARGANELVGKTTPCEGGPKAALTQSGVRMYATVRLECRRR